MLYLNLVMQPCAKTFRLTIGNLHGFIIWLSFFFATALFVFISYLWLDRPIALWVRANIHLHQETVLKPLTQAPNPIIILSAIVFVILGLKAFNGRLFAKHEVVSFLCSISVLATESIKDILKFVFGRTWPKTWTDNNPSFLHDGVYGFNFLHGGMGYQSFPSGHMATIVAAAVLLGIYYPKSRWACFAICIVVGASLIGANYHFLSDVIAGGFLGSSIAIMTLGFWNSQRSNSIENVGSVRQE